MPNATALIIIDVQVAMFSDAEQPHDGPGMLQRIASLARRARDAGVPVIYVQHGGDHAPFTTGTPTWQIQPDIAPLEGEPVVHKRHCDSFQETTLEDELAARGIRQLVLTGMQTDFCVDTTCRRAYSLGYDVTLVSDCHSTFSDEALPSAQIVAHHNTCLRAFAKVIPSAEVAF